MTNLRLKLLLGVVGSVGIFAAAQTAFAQATTPAAPATTAAPAATTAAPASAAAGGDVATVAALGEPLYRRNCQPCHGDVGQGSAGPTLVHSSIVASVGGIVNQILEGNEEHGMPPFAGVLSNDQIAEIATFERNSFGNSYGIVTPADVAGARGGG